MQLFGFTKYFFGKPDKRQQLQEERRELAGLITVLDPVCRFSSRRLTRAAVQAAPFYSKCRAVGPGASGILFFILVQDGFCRFL